MHSQGPLSQHPGYLWQVIITCSSYHISERRGTGMYLGPPKIGPGERCGTRDNSKAATATAIAMSSFKERGGRISVFPFAALISSKLMSWRSNSGSSTSEIFCWVISCLKLP